MTTQSRHVDAASVIPATHLLALAQSLDCLTVPELCLLADIAPATAESWRKRGRGPAYVLIGNRFLYPRSTVAEWLMSNVREHASTPAKGLL